MIEKMKNIRPRITESEKRLEIVLLEPLYGDWVMIFIIVVGSIPLSWYTTPNLLYFTICQIFYWGLAYTMIDDTFETVIDLDKNRVEVIKSKFGRIDSIKTSPADELINAEVVEVTYSKKVTYRLEMEFMTDFGYVRIQTAETLILGKTNKEILESVASRIRKFKNLKPIPDWMKEDNLRKTMPASMKQRERDELRLKSQ